MANPVIKSMFWKLVENALQDASSEWISKWLKSENSLFKELLKPNGENNMISRDDLIQWKSQILKLLNDVSVEDMKKHCINAKAEFEKQFQSKKAEKVFQKELTDIKKFIKSL